MNDCVFCKIVAGELPSSKVYEDDTHLVFLSIRPINEGHCLVIPKRHVQNSHELDEADYLGLMKVVRKISIAVDAAFKPAKVGLMVSGWDVPHVHVHVVPLNDEDDITSRKSIEDTLHNPSREELAQVSGKLSEVASSI